ncbi:hypothetical protein Hanom_Chr10g00875391 [Helianthus anomalus]
MVEGERGRRETRYYGKKNTVFFLQTAKVWSTSSATDVCRCCPETEDVLSLKKQTTP